jgi:hypothetical protein
MNNKIDKTMVPVLLGLLLSSTTSNAADFFAGPPNPNNGFSEYLTDANGLELELCLDPAFCLFDPLDPTNDFSNQIGFGAEGFWWLAEPDTSGFPGTIGATLVLAAEAAFAAEVPIDGDQFPFTRLRIRLDLPVPGIYRVTEPYGVHIYTVTAVGAGLEVNESFDVQFNQGTIDDQGNVTEAVNTYGGPWLTWDTYPNDAALENTGDGVADFIGDGATPHAVIGSPAGNNFFKIEAFSDAALTVPLNTFDPGDGDDDGSANSVTASLFTVVGKVYDGRLATAMSAERLTYSRDAGGTGQVDVFTRGAATASVTAAGGPNLGGPFSLLADQGNFFLSQQLTPNAVALPSSVNIEATDTTADPTRLIQSLSDFVSITRAEYDLGASPPALTIEAASSDALTPPVLTIVELDQPLTAGSAVITETAAGDPIAPPALVTVSSSAGGLATSLVAVVNSADEDGDGVSDDLDNCPQTPNSGQADTDADSIGNACDNCLQVANTDQRDTNDDGFGNACDADLDNSGVVNLADFQLFRGVFGESPLSQLGDDADFDGDGNVNLGDYGKFRSVFGQKPGPSCCAP